MSGREARSRFVERTTAGAKGRKGVGLGTGVAGRGDLELGFPGVSAERQ